MKLILLFLIIFSCSNGSKLKVTPIDGKYVGKEHTIIILDNLLTVDTFNKYTILHKDSDYFLVGKDNDFLKWCYIYRKDKPLNIGYLIVQDKENCEKFSGWNWVSYIDQD